MRRVSLSGNTMVGMALQKLKIMRIAYRQASKTKKAMLWFTVCSFIQRGISFLTVPLFTRLMTQSEYGEFSVFQSWEQVAFYIVTLGMTYGGFNTAMMKFEKDRDGYTSSVTGLIVSFGLGWVAIAGVFREPLSALLDMSTPLLVMLFCEVVFQGVFDIWICRTKFDFEYRKVLAASLFLAFATPALGVLFVLTMQDKVFGRIISFVLVEGIIAAILIVGVFVKGKSFFNQGYWKFTLLFNIPLLPHYLSQVLLNQSDRIVISVYCGDVQAGIFSIAYSVSMIIMVAVTAVNSAFVPWMYRSLKSKRFSDIHDSILSMVAFFGLAVLLIELLAPEIMAVLAPVEYQEGVYLIPPLSCCTLFIFVYSLCSNVEFFYERNKFAMIASGLSAVLNVALCVLLVPQFGYIVSGYVTLACYILLSFLHFSYAQRLNIRIAGCKVFEGKAIAYLCMALLLASLAVSLLYFSLIARVLAFLLIVAVLVWKRSVFVRLFHNMKM